MRKTLLTFLLAPTLAMAEAGPSAVADYFQVHEPFQTHACKGESGNKEMEVCSVKELAAASSRMKARYQTALSSVGEDFPKLASKLKVNQKLWEQTYHAQCEIQNRESAKGSGYSSILNFCLIQMLNERTSYLSSLTE